MAYEVGSAEAQVFTGSITSVVMRDGAGLRAVAQGRGVCDLPVRGAGPQAMNVAAKPSDSPKPGDQASHARSNQSSATWLPVELRIHTKKEIPYKQCLKQEHSCNARSNHDFNTFL